MEFSNPGKTMQIKNHITAGCFLVRKGSNSWEIVLVYKKWSENNQGWVPPKGHVEAGETLEEAAIRETIEETGYKNLKILKKLDTLHIDYPWDDGYIHHKDIHYFLAELIDDEKIELKLSEKEKDSVVKVKWISFENALKELLFDDEREILRKVMKHYNVPII
jgi:8-oxo-dGTP pyrophosphatase MutT (NUDIX family)